MTSTSSIIHYFYTQHRLFYPNELESIEFIQSDIILLTFQLDHWALLFFLKLANPKNKKLSELYQIDTKGSFPFDEQYIYRNVSMLNSCVLQRPIPQNIPIKNRNILDPLNKRTNPRCISRWNGLIRMDLRGNRSLNVYVYNQPYSHPSNKKQPLYTLPPPIIERFELTSQNIENYYIEENDQCVVIDISLSDLLHFDQYSFIATEIESDKEKLSQKYAEKKYQRQIEDLEEQKREIAMHSDSDSMELQNIDREIYEIEQMIASLNKKEDKKQKDDDLSVSGNSSNDEWLRNLRENQHLLQDTPGNAEEYYDDYRENEEYYQQFEQLNNFNLSNGYDEETDDEDVLNDFDKRKQICPSLRIRGYCNRRDCDYKYHPQMEQNVDFGNESTKWINPNLHKIHSAESAHKHPKDINEEFLNYLIDDSSDKENATFYLQDVIHNCFILRITIIKNADFIKKEWYARRLKEIFPDQRDKHFLIGAPEYMTTPTQQNIPYPFIRTIKSSNNDQKEQYVDHLTSPLSYISTKDLMNADYRESMKQFIKRLNDNNGQYHMEAFCLMACLINYPPIFIVEDFHQCDFYMLMNQIETGEIGKVWQVLKKLSEGNINKIKWKEFHSSGTGNVGSGQKGELDKNISDYTASCRERYCIRGEPRDGYTEARNVSFMEIFNDIYFNVGEFLNELKQQNMGYSSNRYEWIKSLKVTQLYYGLVVDQEMPCRMFRLKKHLKRSAIDFLRVEFVTNRRGQRFSNHFEYGSFTRQQVYNIMTHGLLFLIYMI